MTIGKALQQLATEAPMSRAKKKNQQD